MKFKKLLLILSLSFAPTIFAEESANNAPSLGGEFSRDWRLSAGAGIFFKRNNRNANTYDKLDKKIITRVLPYIQGSYKGLSLGHQGISYRIVGNPFLSFSTFVNRAGDKYLGEGMAPRKDSVFFGFAGKMGKYNLTLSRDINGRSKGILSQFNYSEMTIVSDDLLLLSSLSLEWHDDSYAEYFFGVKSSESTSTRKEYHVHNFFRPGISVMPIYKLWDRVSLVSALNLKYIPLSVRQSPTMNGKSLEISTLFALNYRF